VNQKEAKGSRFYQQEIEYRMWHLVCSSRRLIFRWAEVRLSNQALPVSDQGEVTVLREPGL
jgi:hypothetical protein